MPTDVMLDFRECSVTLALEPAKAILRDVSSQVQSGELLAVMGPSGSGKTTLLNLLSGAPGSSYEYRSGMVTLNGATLNSAMYQSYCAVVTQFDRNWIFLTSREHIDLAHALHQAALGTEVRSEANEALLKKTGLSSCADVIAGSDDLWEPGPVGLSGGQLRRLSLAIALAKKPAVLIADEPTSGLDGAAAAATMRLIHEVAVDDRVAVVCTIHQPSASVYERVGSLLVLSKGCVAYLGKASDLIEYTTSLGTPPPPGVSISEHMLDLVNADFTSETEVEAMIEAWQKRAPPLAAPPPPTSLPDEPLRGPWIRQLRYLFWRQFSVLLVRDPVVMLVFLFLVFTDMTWAGVFYFRPNRTNDQNESNQKTYFVVTLVTLPTIQCAVHVFEIANAKRRVVREVGNGMYPAPLYMIVAIAKNLCVSLVIGLVGSIYSYLWGDMHWPSLPYTVLLLGANQFFFSMAAFLCGWSFGSRETGIMLYLLIWVVSMATSGFYVDLEVVAYPLRILCYINPLHYTIGAINYHLIRDAPDAPGATLCDPHVLTCPSGFRCDSDNATFKRTACYGVTGEQVLASLHVLHSIIPLDDVVWQYLAIIFGYGLAVGVIVTLVLFAQSQARVVPAPPSAALLPAPFGSPSADGFEKTHVEKGDPQKASETSVSSTAVSSMLPGAIPVKVVIDDVSLQLEKQAAAEEGTFLLKNVSASCSSGEVLAVMGPSGAGKTALLNVLTSVSANGHSADQRKESSTGRVTLNGVSLDPWLVRRSCAWMPQKDALFTFLSCHDHVRYAVTLYQGRLSEADVKETCDAILRKTGLHSCAQVRAGNVEYLGLSGGQRRRLSLALCLAKRPSLLIIDEPTTGLDDAAAAAIMKLLYDMSASASMATVCTIHQPGVQVFSRMNRLLILSGGRVAYYGQASDLNEYTTSLGKPPPPGVSISEHMLDLVNADFTSETEVEAMIEAWQKRAPPPETHASITLPPELVRPSLLRMYQALFAKTLKVMWYDPNYLVQRALGQFLISLMYGLLARKASDHEQEDAQPLFFMSFYNIMSVQFMAMTYVNGSLDRWVMFKREIEANMYGPVAYITIIAVLDLIPALVCATVNVLPIALLTGMPTSSLLPLLMLVFAFILVYDAFIDILIVAGRDVCNFWLSLYSSIGSYASGTFIPWHDVMWPFRIFSYVFPHRYAFTAIVTLAFGEEDHHWEGAYRLSTAPPDIRYSEAGISAALRHQDFVCPKSPDVCLGDNGNAVLKAYTAFNSGADADLRWGNSLGVLFGMAIFFRCIAYLAYMRVAPQSKEQSTSGDAAGATESSALLPST